MKTFEMAAMDMIQMEMSKIRKVADGHKNEVRTMVNRPRNTLTINDLQNGCCGGHHGYSNKMV